MPEQKGQLEGKLTYNDPSEGVVPMKDVAVLVQPEPVQGPPFFPVQMTNREGFYTYGLNTGYYRVTFVTMPHMANVVVNSQLVLPESTTMVNAQAEPD